MSDSKKWQDEMILLARNSNHPTPWQAASPIYP
jgi:hypothetical protein